MGRYRIHYTVESGTEVTHEKSIVSLSSLEGFIASVSCELGTKMDRKNSIVELYTP